MVNKEMAGNLYKFLGIDTIIFRLRRIERALGLRGNKLQTFTGNQPALDAGLKPGDFYKTGTGSLMIVHE